MLSMSFVFPLFATWDFIVCAWLATASIILFFDLVLAGRPCRVLRLMPESIFLW